MARPREPAKAVGAIRSPFASPETGTSAHINSMSTLTHARPGRTEIKRDLRWAVTDGIYESEFLTSSTQAAAWLVDEAMRKHLKGETPTIGVHLHDQLLGVIWDATPDVTDVFTAVGWPKTTDDTLEFLRLRASVIGIIRDILVSDDTPADAPEPGISDPHTYALVCR